MNPAKTHRQRDVRRVASAFVAVLVGSVGVACTDLTLDGDEQLSCGSNGCGNSS